MSKNKKKKGGKIFIAVICIILALCIGIGAVGLAYWNKIKNAPPEVEDTMVYDFDADETIPLALADDPEFDKIFEGENAADLRSAIKNWVTDDTNIMYSENVINILCIGVDTRNKNTISGLTDSMIVVSINKKLGTITFTSIMRDSYAYLIAPDGTGSYNKINSAFPFYGIDNLISTIQSHFKIRIDGYAMINFALFKAVIDKLGGVNVNLSEREANHFKKNYGWDLQPGSSVNLNGDQALAFCRSRKIYNDGDVQRTQNQREVLIALLKKAATIKPEEIPDYVATFMPYLETSYKETEVLSLATKAVVGGWATFKVQDLVMPDEESRRAHSGDVWYWEVDYPLAAQKMQEAIYGESIIELAENRTGFY